MEFNPLLVKEFYKSLSLRKTKTDKVDAIVICQKLMSVPYKPNSKLFYHKYGLKLFTRLRDAYTHGIKDNRGIMGNTYTSHKQGIDMSYVDRLEPITNFAIQGSTRCQMNMGKNFVSTICLNPASIGIERALIEQQKINDKRIKNNQKSLQLVKDFEFEHGKEKVTYHLVDARLMAPSAKTVEPITTQNAKLALRLQFLDKVMKEYDRNNTKDVKVMKKV